MIIPRLARPIRRGCCSRPPQLEARLAGQPDTATVAAVLAALRADPDWELTTLTLAGRIVHVTLVELDYRPTGVLYTLRVTRGRHATRSSGRGPQADDDDTPGG